MLTTKKTTRLSGESRIEDVIAMTLDAEVSREAAENTFVRQNIINQELYNANKKECRKDITNFQEEVFDLEDSFMAEEAKEVEATE